MLSDINDMRWGNGVWGLLSSLQGIREWGTVTLTCCYHSCSHLAHWSLLENIYFLSNLRDLGFSLSGNEKTGWQEALTAERKESVFQGLQGQGAEGLWTQSPMSEGWRWKMSLVARMFVFILFYFSKPWDRKKKKRPPISRNSSCFLLEGKSKRSRPLSFNQMTPHPHPPSPCFHSVLFNDK